MEHPSNTAIVERYEHDRVTKKKVTLESCIAEYSKEELLGESDTWYCPQCKDHKRIKKKIDIWSVPDVRVY